MMTVAWNVIGALIKKKKKKQGWDRGDPVIMINSSLSI